MQKYSTRKRDIIDIDGDSNWITEESMEGPGSSRLLSSSRCRGGKIFPQKCYIGPTFYCCLKSVLARKLILEVDQTYGPTHFLLVKGML